MDANTARMDMEGAFPQMPAPNGGRNINTNSTQGHEDALLADAPVTVSQGPWNYHASPRPRRYTNDMPSRSSAGTYI